MLQRPQPYILLTTLAGFRHFVLSIRTVGPTAATFYYLSTPRLLVFQPRLSHTLRRLGFISRHIVFQPLLVQALPRLPYNTRRLFFPSRLSLAHPRLRFKRPLP